MFLLRARWNEFASTPMEEPRDGSITRSVYIYVSTTQQWASHQWARRLNRHPELVHIASLYPAKFTICSPCYVQTRQINQDKNNSIYSILMQ
jgi:hypothetical protein